MFHEWLTNDSEIRIFIVDARIDQSIRDFLIFNVSSSDLFSCFFIDGAVTQESEENTEHDDCLIDSHSPLHSLTD